MSGKYTPLEHYLRDLPTIQKEVTMSFEQIERIINDKLPLSAYQYSAWWSHEKEPHQPQKQALSDAGWRMETVDFGDKWIKFTR